MAKVSKSFLRRLNAIAHTGIKPPRLAKQGFVAGGAAAAAVAGGVILRIGLGFHNHAPKQLARGLALHQQAADQLGGNLLGGAGEEALGEVGGYGGGFCEEVLSDADGLLTIS